MPLRIVLYLAELRGMWVPAHCTTAATLRHRWQQQLAAEKQNTSLSCRLASPTAVCPLSTGADVNVTDRHGRSGLLAAAQSCSTAS
jgi:hypothetical protein